MSWLNDETFTAVVFYFMITSKREMYIYLFVVLLEYCLHSACLHPLTHVGMLRGCVAEYSALGSMVFITN